MNDKITNIAGRLARSSRELFVKGAKQTGNFIYDHRQEAFGATVGFTKGMFNVMSDIYGHTKTEKDYNGLIEKLKEQSEEYKKLHEELKERKCEKELLFDSIGISFVYMNDYLIVKKIPSEVQNAYEGAYPGLAENQSLEELIAQKSDEEIAGIVNGIKGKLFEQRYIEYLNDGNLPDGYHAVLADSPTNPGWDIAILDESGGINEVLQAKATGSIEYVREALSRYPDIQIVTTEEVFGHLSMHGMAENVINSGITNEEITMVVESSINSGQDVSLNLGPSIIPAIIIGYSVYKAENLTKYEKGEEFGKRYVESYLSGVVGGIAMCVSNFWLLGLVATLGSKYVLYRGRKKKILYDGLTDNIRYNQKIIDDMRRRVSYC